MNSSSAALWKNRDTFTLCVVYQVIGEQYTSFLFLARVLHFSCLVNRIEVSTNAVLSIEIITIVEPTKNYRQSEFDLKMIRTLTILLPITSLGL
jgi:hypothetical protein